MSEQSEIVYFFRLLFSLIVSLVALGSLIGIFVGVVHLIIFQPLVLLGSGIAGFILAAVCYHTLFPAYND